MTKYIVASFAAIVILSGCTGIERTVTESDEVQTASQVAGVQEEYVAPIDNLHARDLMDNIPVGTLTQAEEDGLILMREEEKLARDVYLTLYDKWGERIFSNIASSEQTHTDTVKYLIDRYDLEDPVKDDTVGAFTDLKMQELYDDLVVQGSVSVGDAFIVGMTIEDLDIKDLQDLLAETQSEDIRIAYENLLRGSRNHMRAFNRQLEREGLTYEAQFLTQEEIDEILAGEQEHGSGGGGNGGGQGGRGQGGRGGNGGGGQGGNR